MKIIDLTHTFDGNMPSFPGDPKSTLKQVAFIDRDTYNDYLLHTVMHVGTHMDAPFHMVAEGRKMSEIEPEKFIGQGVLVDVRAKREIGVDCLKNVKVEKGSVVLLYTGRASKYKTKEYFKDMPFLTEDFAKRLVELGVKMVGMDMLGPDLDKPWPTHKILLGNEVLILENLTNLDQLMGVENFEIIALPPKLEADAALVRVIARL